MRPRAGSALGRLLAGLLLLAVIVALTVGVAIPLVELKQSYGRELEQLKSQRRILKATRDERPLLDAKLAELEEERAWSHLLFAAGSESLDAAEFQDTLKEVIASAKGSLESMEIRDSVSDAAIQRLVLSVRFSGTMTSVRDALYAIEYGERLVLVDQVIVRAGRAQLQADPTVAPEVSVTLDVSAFRSGDPVP